LNRSGQNLTLFSDEPRPVEGPLVFETAARKAGFAAVAGVDEAGRGPLAGPVVAAAVILPEDAALDGVRDSKQMTEKARSEAFSVIHEKAFAVGVGVIPPAYIDEHNILNASLEAMRRAVSFLDPRPDFLLVDGIHPVPMRTHQRCLKQGDSRSLSISAASVIAKVYRDRIMCSLDARFPQYGFSSHKGYGTSAHLEALRRHGPCPIHRRSFRGVSAPADVPPF
jgi:ribonuclease HII